MDYFDQYDIFTLTYLPLVGHIWPQMCDLTMCAIFMPNRYSSIETGTKIPLKTNKNTCIIETHHLAKLKHAYN